MNDIWKALSHPMRREIISLLRNGSMNVTSISGNFDCSGATLSGHLKILKEADLVSMTSEGNIRIYSLNATVAEEALSGMLDLIRFAQTDKNAEAAPPNAPPHPKGSK